MRKVGPTFSRVTAELDRRRSISLGFERIEALLAALGNPERYLRVVQVVGTNGKGTTSVALSAALEATGEATGTYLSPHVVSYAERVRLRGEQVSEKAFAKGMDEAISVADGLGIEVTQFELLTAGALAMFREEGVTWAVLEAGLGARYDATTAAGPEAVVLTNVSLDHTEYLGNSVREIATEKLASVPENGVLILGTDNQEVVGLARSRCGELPARLVEASDEASAASGYLEANVRLGCRAAGELTGEHIPENLVTHIREQVPGSLPGRFEVRTVGDARVILDGGHNVEGLRATLEKVRREYSKSRIGVVFGVLRDKDIAGMLELLGGAEVSLFLTRPDDERAAEPWSIFGLPGVGSCGEVYVEPNVAEAVRRAVTVSGGVVLVTGSFVTVAGARRFLDGRQGGV